MLILNGKQHQELMKFYAVGMPGPKVLRGEHVERVVSDRTGTTFARADLQLSAPKLRHERGDVGIGWQTGLPCCGTTDEQRFIHGAVSL
ncbi:hypothetical protein ACODT5_02370 [Streptomyces sp. 5.8]|uniref:hypothetical protein n=1 Tax=Streptomyces sp. 5.8 TaxID=3406571 RepID=UPI003BB5E9E7